MLADKMRHRLEEQQTVYRIEEDMIKDKYSERDHANMHFSQGTPSKRPPWATSLIKVTYMQWFFLVQSDYKTLKCFSE